MKAIVRDDNNDSGDTPVRHAPPPPPPPPPPPSDGSSSPSTVDIKAKKLEAMHKLIADYEAQKPGGIVPFENYVNARLGDYINDHGFTPTVGGEASEPGLKSEDPISWLIYGWEIGTAGFTEATLKFVIEKGVDYILESFKDSHVDTPPPIDYTPTDGGVPMGTPTSQLDGNQGGGDQSGTPLATGDQSGATEEGGACFVAGTVVLTPQGLIPIEQIRVADEVYAFDRNENGMVSQQVSNVITAQRQEILVLDFGDEKIRCTPPHRFYTGQWKAAKELQVGDAVLSRDGQWKTLKLVLREIQKQMVYNLTVEGKHNYLVGLAGLVVHNDKNVTGDDDADLLRDQVKVA